MGGSGLSELQTRRFHPTWCDMRILRTLPPESSTAISKGCLVPNLASEIDGPHAMMAGQPEPMLVFAVDCKCAYRTRDFACHKQRGECSGLRIGSRTRACNFNSRRERGPRPKPSSAAGYRAGVEFG